MYFADVSGRAAMQDASLETLITRMERMRRNHPTLTFDVARYENMKQAEYLFKLFPGEQVRVLHVTLDNIGRNPQAPDENNVWVQLCVGGEWSLMGYIADEMVERYYSGFTLVDTLGQSAKTYVKIISQDVAHALGDDEEIGW